MIGFSCTDLDFANPMILGNLSTWAIVANPPGIVEQQLHHAREWLTGSFVGHMFLDHPNEFITATATIVVAIFTVVLALSTVRLWHATHKSAQIAERALTELEAPFLGLNITQPGLKPHFTDRDKVVKNNSGLQYGFFNHGRTPAVLLELQDELQICDAGKLPVVLRRKISPYPYGVFVGAGTTSVPSTRVFADYFTGDEFLKVSTGGSNLFLVGKVKYRDIFQKTFEMGFCAYYDRGVHHFLMEGGDDYNYLREI